MASTTTSSSSSSSSSSASSTLDDDRPSRVYCCNCLECRSRCLRVFKKPDGMSKTVLLQLLERVPAYVESLVFEFVEDKEHCAYIGDTPCWRDVHARSGSGRIRCEMDAKCETVRMRMDESTLCCRHRALMLYIVHCGLGKRLVVDGRHRPSTSQCT